jgi:hypothetical protein
LTLKKLTKNFFVLVLDLLLLSPNESAKENSFQQKERKVQFTQPWDAEKSGGSKN